ncbi:MAG: type II secretion system ATPase GspE [Candidatus Firestonebacteria bacterium]|nr:type II secretion system ATPase GspE [Candidatus Firestonebacteria bacterium]
MKSISKLIGEILIHEGFLDKDKLKEALEIQKKEKPYRRIGEILIELGYVSQEDFLLSLGNQLGIPFYHDLSIYLIDKDIISKIPLNFVKKNNLIPILCKNKTLTVAVTDPLNLQPLDDIGLLLGYHIEPIISTDKEIKEAINRIYAGETDSTQKMLSDLKEAEINLPSIKEDEQEDLLDIVNKAPIIKFVNLILTRAVNERASDIHIEPFDKDLIVRYRVDGMLYEALRPPKQYQAAIISRIKIMGNLNIAERRLPQDGRIKIKIVNHEIDIRLSTIPVTNGERIVMRLLDKSNLLLNLQELGFSSDIYQKFKKIIQGYNGIILVTGPTGSGKTTTLYAALSQINSVEKNIITIEDPVEYQIEGIGQIQINSKIDLTFANGLRSILRQDPDIIMVGEIRDYETAEISIHASLTGHLVFSTLHTNDASGAITRIIDMGVEPYLVSSSVIAILAQRLVRVICSHCKESFSPPPELLKEIRLSPDDLINGVIYRGKGCPECLNTGYKGRLGIYELLLIDGDVRNAILSKKDSSFIKKLAHKKGMMTLRDDGAQKVIKGITTIHEVLRVTQEDIQ